MGRLRRRADLDRTRVGRHDQGLSLAVHHWLWRGNILETPIEELWSHADRLLFNRTRSIDELWGFCGTCYYAEVCRGGCTWTADSLFGRPGNNPYCHYRALQLESRGRRERIVKRREAPAESFAIGEFELIEEPIPGREAEAASGGATALTSAGGAPIRRLPPVREDGLAAEMTLCRECECFIWPDETTCPHCGGDVRAAAARHERTRGGARVPARHHRANPSGAEGSAG